MQIQTFKTHSLTAIKPKKKKNTHHGVSIIYLVKFAKLGVFIFLNDVKVPCELPESYEAYKKQQHRWHSGPMQLFRLCLPAIITSKISTWKKGNLIFLFFLLRKLILPFYSFTLFCIVLPLTMFIPKAELPIWVICYIPIFMSFLNILPAPKSFPFLIPYLLFENTMSVTSWSIHRVKLVKFGAVLSLVSMVKSDDSASWILLILCNLAACIEGKSTMLDANAVGILVGILRENELDLEATRENCLAALFGLAHGSLRFIGLAKEARAVEVLREIEQRGSERAKEKAKKILQMMRRR